MDSKRPVFKYIAIGVAAAVILLGVIFIALDVLDIAEGYRLHWPIATVNTALIGGAALVTLYFATRSYLVSGSPVALGLGGATVAFGFSIILYGWLTGTDLNTRITTYDSGVLLASGLHLLGAVLSLAKPGAAPRKGGGRLAFLLAVYLGALLIIAVIAWLAHRDSIATFGIVVFEDILTLRGIVLGGGVICCAAAGLIYLRSYCNKRGDSYFWYLLGLTLFAAGVIFISQGALESRVAWLGRVSQYLAGIYLLLAAVKSWRGDKPALE
jgi:hypothetical protein